MKTFVSFALFLFSLNTLFAQDKWYVTVTMPRQMTVAKYDGLFEKIGAAGLTNCYSEYHAAGPGMDGSFIGFTTFRSKTQLDARLQALKPFLGQVNPMPYEIYKMIPGQDPGRLTDKTIIAHFDIKGMTEAQYDQILAAMEKTGQVENPACLYHIAYKTPEGLKVLDVWTDAESFQAAGQTLVPVILSTGVTPPEPAIFSAHAIRVPAQSDRNLEAVHGDYAAFGRGDVATVLASLTEDCNWFHAGDPAVVPFGGTFIGKAGVGRFFENIAKTLQVTRFQPADFQASGDRVQCHIDIAGTVIPTGKPFAIKVQ